MQRLPIRILVVTTLNNKKQNDNNSPLSINNGMIQMMILIYIKDLLMHIKQQTMGQH